MSYAYIQRTITGTELTSQGKKASSNFLNITGMRNIKEWEAPGELREELRVESCD